MRTIKQIAEKLNISVSSIRYYERKGLLTVQRGENNYRQYTVADEEKIKLILVMKYSGFSIKEIKELFALDNEQIVEPECMDRTNELIVNKKKQILEKIENQKKIVQLLNMMRPLAVAKITEESKTAFEQQVDLIYKETIKGEQE